MEDPVRRPDTDTDTDPLPDPDAIREVTVHLVNRADGVARFVVPAHWTDADIEEDADIARLLAAQYDWMGDSEHEIFVVDSWSGGRDPRARTSDGRPLDLAGPYFADPRDLPDEHRHHLPDKVQHSVRILALLHNSGRPESCRVVLMVDGWHGVRHSLRFEQLADEGVLGLVPPTVPGLSVWEGRFVEQDSIRGRLALGQWRRPIPREAAAFAGGQLAELWGGR